MEKPNTPLSKDLVVGFFIGIVLYIAIFSVKLLKVLIKGRWKFDMIRHGVSNTFNQPDFLLSQLMIIVLSVAGSMTLYYFYKKGYFEKVYKQEDSKDK